MRRITAVLSVLQKRMCCAESSTTTVLLCVTVSTYEIKIVRLLVYRPVVGGVTLYYRFHLNRHIITYIALPTHRYPKRISNESCGWRGLLLKFIQTQLHLKFLRIPNISEAACLIMSIDCDVTPLVTSSQGLRPDRGRICSGWSSRIGERIHPLLFCYLIVWLIIFFLAIVSLVSSRREAEWLAILIAV